MENDMRADVEAAVDANDPERLGMTTCPHCGEKIPASNTAPGSVGGGGAATGGSGGSSGGG